MRNALRILLSAAALAVALRPATTDCAYAAEGTITATPPPQTVPGGEQGLVGYWRFDERKGAAAQDSSTYGHDGHVYGAAWAKGVAGSALAFNGVSDYVTVPSPGRELKTKAVSVEAWIQSTGTNTNATLVFAGHESLDFGIWIQGGRFFAGLWNSAGTQYSAIAASGPTPGRWYHVAMTCDFERGKVIKLYINGVLNCTCTATGEDVPPAVETRPVTLSLNATAAPPPLSRSFSAVGPNSSSRLAPRATPPARAASPPAPTGSRNP